MGILNRNKNAYKNVNNRSQQTHQSQVVIAANDAHPPPLVNEFAFLGQEHQHATDQNLEQNRNAHTDHDNYVQGFPMGFDAEHLDLGKVGCQLRMETE